mgnify:CR=1 FL=1
MRLLRMRCRNVQHTVPCRTSRFTCGMRNSWRVAGGGNREQCCSATTAPYPDVVQHVFAVFRSVSGFACVSEVGPLYWSARSVQRAHLFLVSQTFCSGRSLPSCLAAVSMAMQKPTVADVKKAIAPAIAVANAVIAAPAFAEGTGEVDPTLISFHSVRAPWVRGGPEHGGLVP